MKNANAKSDPTGLRGYPAGSDEELCAVIEFPLSKEERRATIERAKRAAETLEAEALQCLNMPLSMDGRMALATSLDQAERIRAAVKALERRL